MALQLCPRCMQKKQDGVKCVNCGFVADEYHAPANVLTPGMNVANCITGIALAVSRQAICYSAMDLETNTQVLLEEFYPSAAVKRENGNVVQKRSDARFAEAAELFANTKETGRKAKLIKVTKENNTVYREYELNPVDNRTPEKAADVLLDYPIRFRDKNDKPLFSINALPIPPLPEKKRIEVRTNGKAKKKFLIISIFLILILAGLVTAWLLR